MAMTITIELTDDQEAILKHDLEDPKQWVQDMVDNKIANCASRMEGEAVRVLMADPEVAEIPADPSQLRAAFVSRPGYKNRRQRESSDQS